MSLVDQRLPSRELALPAEVEPVKSTTTYEEAVPRSSQSSCYSTPQMSYDAADITSFYVMDDSDVVIASPSKEQAPSEAPALPPKNALRASRLIDAGFNLSLAAPVENRDLTVTTPHDFYLSSEEDASSSADDFSDYDYDSSIEDAESPGGRRSSHEDTARVVSVVFSGKPSLIDLSSIRRSISPSSIEARRQRANASSIDLDSTISASSASHRSQTSSSSFQTESSDVLPPRGSSMISAMLAKGSFLHIDPYANGSTYSLEPQAPVVDRHEDDSTDTGSIKGSIYSHRRTPSGGAALLRGVSRTFSLVRQRSRPLLRNLAGQQQAASQMQLDDAASILSTRSREDAPATARQSMSFDADTPVAPQSPVTYGEIMRAARSKAKQATQLPPPLSLPPPPPTPQNTLPVPPPTPTSQMKGFLGQLTGRRKSTRSTTGRPI